MLAQSERDYTAGRPTEKSQLERNLLSYQIPLASRKRVVTHRYDDQRAILRTN